MLNSDNQKIIVVTTLLIGFLFYSLYIYYCLPVRNGSDNAESVNGKLVWQQYNCNACHQVYGLGGYLGPDLTNAYSARGKDYINSFLKYGTAAMPNFNLKEPEITALLAYLKDIDASGRSDPRSFTINYDGTIEQ